jgi:hypothetical protein
MGLLIIAIGLLASAMYGEKRYFAIGVGGYTGFGARDGGNTGLKKSRSFEMFSNRPLKEDDGA